MLWRHRSGGGDVAAELRVNPVALHVTSADIGSAGCDYAVDALRHRESFIEAVSRWRGAASKAALHETGIRWEVRHAAHLERVSGLGQHVCDAALKYSVDAAESADAMRSVLGAVADAAGGAVPDSVL